MPKQVDRMPGPYTQQLDWTMLSDGHVYEFTEEELAEAEVSIDTVRVAAHNYAKKAGFKFRTKVKDDSLYIQAQDLARQEG